MQMKTSAFHQLTNASPVPEQQPPRQPPPQFYYWVWCRTVWNIPLVSWGQQCQLCPLSTSCAPPVSTRWWGGVRSRKGLDCVSTA